MGVSMFILMPLTFASNIFVDPRTMPDWLQGFVELNPVSVVVGTVRELMGGTYDIGSVGAVLAVLRRAGGMFGPLSTMIYNREQ